MRSADDLVVVESLTFTIGGSFLASAARQWIAETEAEDTSEPLDATERSTYGMNAEETRVYLDLRYPGGARAFIEDYSE